MWNILLFLRMSNNFGDLVLQFFICGIVFNNTIFMKLIIYTWFNCDGLKNHHHTIWDLKFIWNLVLYSSNWMGLNMHLHLAQTTLVAKYTLKHFTKTFVRQIMHYIMWYMQTISLTICAWHLCNIGWPNNLSHRSKAAFYEHKCTCAQYRK